MTAPAHTPVTPARDACAWAAFDAILKAERRDPALRSNPCWKVLRWDAYEEFERAMVAGT
jgi:hypothetical protein